MVATITNICDPGLYDLNEAIEKAKSTASDTPGFELHIVRFLQSLCLSRHVPMATVFRGLDVLGGILDENRLVTLLRPFLRSSDPHIASKCVLVIGRQSRNMAWLLGIMNESDERIRANLIQAIWKRKEPEVELVLRNAVGDPHPRVAANAVYGLYLLGIDAWIDGLERLVGSDGAAFRKSGIWMLKSSGAHDAPARLKRLIRDTDADVRRAAFNALVHLRENGPKKAAAMDAPEISA
jgi:HEAT repeat protein